MPENTHRRPEVDGARLPWIDDLGPASLAPTAIAPSAPDSPQVSTAYPRGWLPWPDDDVDASWLRQATLLEVDGAAVRLQACLDEPGMGGVAGDQLAERSAPTWPFATPLLMIGAVRGPSVLYAYEATAQRDRLASQLTQYGVGVVPAWTVDRGHRWTEPACIAFPDLSHEEQPADWQARALGIARQMGIATVVRIGAATYEVLSLGDLPSHRYSVIATAAASATRDDEHRCPMTDSPEAGQYCAMRGGPWTSASIHAAAGWRDVRDRLVEGVGCDTCEGTRYLFQRTVRTGGGPIGLVPIPMPTRWLQADESRLATVEES